MIKETRYTPDGDTGVKYTNVTRREIREIQKLYKDTGPSVTVCVTREGNAVAHGGFSPENTRFEVRLR
jgi:hypothetical protein